MLLEKNTIKENCINEIKNIWLTVPDSFPAFLTEISEDTKTQNEQYIQTVSDNFQKQLKIFSSKSNGREKWKLKTSNMLKNVLCEETIIGIHRCLNQQAIELFQDELKDFIRHVRQFAPELSIEGIGQATRNYIVYAMFNEIHQMKPGFNKASFGYSMLYPFTDNYIDSKNYSHKEKIEYNQIIKDQIEGKEVHTKSEHQLKTCKLLQMIETEYPRDSNSTIFMLLLMMLEAQEDSMRQQNRGFTLTAEEILDISLYKGGISVLIDRFFVKKEITREDLIFYFGLGFFLQMADDLQDIKEDSMDGNQTIFTVDLNCQQEEKIVNKLIHFIRRISDSYQIENNMFKNFILSNCYQLIYSSIAGSKDFFSKEYLNKLERYLPVTYHFLENMKKNQIKYKNIKIQDKYMKILDEMLI